MTSELRTADHTISGRSDSCFPTRVHGIEVLMAPGAAVLSARGELDAYVVSDLTAAFEELAHAGEGVVIDLDAVTFMDSTALGIVVRAVRELGEAGKNVKVVLPRGVARRVFEITTVERVLPVADSRAEALAELVAAC